MRVVIYKRVCDSMGRPVCVPVGVHPGSDVARAEADVYQNLGMFPELVGSDWFGRLTDDAKAEAIRDALLRTEPAMA